MGYEEERSPHSKNEAAVLATITNTWQPVPVTWRSHKVHQQQGQGMTARTKAREGHVIRHGQTHEKLSEITEGTLRALLSHRLANV